MSKILLHLSAGVRSECRVVFRAARFCSRSSLLVDLVCQRLIRRLGNQSVPDAFRGATVIITKRVLLRPLGLALLRFVLGVPKFEMEFAFFLCLSRSLRFSRVGAMIQRSTELAYRWRSSSRLIRVCAIGRSEFARLASAIRHKHTWNAIPARWPYQITRNLGGASVVDVFELRCSYVALAGVHRYLVWHSVCVYACR